MLPNIALFMGQDALNLSTLWETNGTGSGTFELAVTGTGVLGLTPRSIMVLGDQVLFEGADSAGHLGLWTTDGTALGTSELTSIAGASTAGLAPSDLTVFVVGSEALFSGIDSNGQTGLWMTNGTAAGTQELTGIVGTAAAGLAPADLTILNGEALFEGTDTAGHFGLWVTNGTAAGTHELTGLTAASATGIDPSDMAVVNNEVLFNGVDANGLSGLWVTDGTVGGTHELLAGGGAVGLNPTDLTVFNNEVVFNGREANGNMGLWVSDGTATGTHELTGIAGADSSGLGLAPSDFTVLGDNEILFRGFDQSGRPQLWVTNGTAAGTHELIGIVGAGATASGFDPSGFKVYDGMALFSGRDSSGHAELWTTDGTVAGTTEISPSSPSQSTGLVPLDLTVLTQGGLPLPTIEGTVPGQRTTSEAPVTPFSQVTIGDANIGATDTLTITLDGVGGTLSDGTGFTSLATVSGAVYKLSGTAAAITSELDALVFTPIGGAPNTSSTTRFTLRDQSSANSVPVTDTSTTVIDTDPPPPITSTILWQNTSGQASIWDMNASTLLGGGAVTPNPGRSFRAVGTGDFNGDGDSDILWQNTSTGQASIWEMNGNTLIGGGTVTPNPGTTWKAIGTGDFNGNGDSDILWQNTITGQASIWEMSGNKLVGGGAVSPNPGPSWKAIGTGDFNKDGDSDILWQNANTGQVSIWEMNGNKLIGGGAVSPNPGLAWKAIGTGDFNGDGFSDILFQNKSSGQLSIWEMNGTSLLGGGKVTPNPGPSWHAIGTDGGSDILFQNTSGQSSIWDMNGTSIAGGGPVTPNPGPSWHAISLT